MIMLIGHVIGQSQNMVGQLEKQPPSLSHMALRGHLFPINFWVLFSICEEVLKRVHYLCIQAVMLTTGSLHLVHESLENTHEKAYEMGHHSIVWNAFLRRL